MCVKKISTVPESTIYIALLFSPSRKITCPACTAILFIRFLLSLPNFSDLACQLSIRIDYSFR
ncbi:hypothetical protein LEP1GSC050_0392 [Leptospira broomii serovar Hurstbridge str. 5399]|uniref:Uncharacterized protein n=1 Tax=Leptospira broomii serovar Hurstbridge str. 5399 TaxID=1049789 RepID=T0F5F1_9LEPT|nr:hypothetical protein LEP1GSC050_0392 [Leptospira broomii serovar Hurstbridge str. 5399]